MGHYVLGHVWKEIVFSSLMMLLTLFLADRAAKVIIARYKERFGFDRLSDIASFPLILLLFGVFGLLSTHSTTGYLVQSNIKQISLVWK